MTSLKYRQLGLTCLVLLLSLGGRIETASGQVDPNAGVLPFSTQDHGVDLATGKVHASIPLRSKIGKIPFFLSLEGNYGVFIYKPGPGTPQWWSYPNFSTTPTSFATWGANYDTCGKQGGQLGKLYVQDSTGAQHSAGGALSCSWQTDGTNFTTTTSDGSGYTLIFASGNATIYDTSGNTFTPTQQQPWIMTDSDGATLTFSGLLGNAGQWTDSLGQNPLTVSYANSQWIYAYTDAVGGNEQYAVSSSSYNFVTKFGCSGINDSNYSNWFSLPTTITTPNGGQYTVAYEQTPGLGVGNITGRISKITYPSGGSTSYSYSSGNKGINCTSGVVPTLKVTENDNNGNVSTWTYVNSNTSSTPGNFTVTESDPVGNQTVFRFSAEYQTEAIYFQGGCSGFPGCNGGGTKIRDVTTCYNANLNGGLGACQTPTTVPVLPITQTDVYTWTGMSGQSLVETTFDVDGNTTKIAHYDWGATVPPTGSPLSTTTMTYDGVNGASCGAVSPYMHDRPCSVTTTGPSGTVGQTTFVYNAAGHPIQISRLVGGQTSLTSYASYNSNGTLASSTDANGAITYYGYTGNGGCSSLLVTSTSLPVNNLSTAQTWDCNGAAVKSYTDASGQMTTYGYVGQNGLADPLWRRLSVTDPRNSTTWITYSAGATTPLTSESTLSVATGSSVDVLTTFDGFGRPYIRQQRQAPSSTNFDTIVTTYDLMGRISGVGLPCVSLASQSCSSSTTVTTYDALDRPLQVTDGGGGYVSYNYAPAGSFNNDVLVTLGPAPAVPVQENTKRRQLEYDGMGRVTSVCELTSTSNGGGNCNQNAGQTGYLTQYAYDGLSRLTGVTQSVQTRTYQYDALGRVTMEANPESGTTTYSYDADSGGSCSGTFNGDLVKRSDSSGNISCYAYDNLHRELSTIYSGPNATTNRYFVYDAATVNGQVMANAGGRLAEGYTATCQTCAKFTDEGFGYTARGELSDFYESTPNSAGYYHVPLTYWPNSLIETFGPFLTEDQAGYVPDGEGRAGSVYDFRYEDYPIPSILYNTASQPTQIMTSCLGTTCYPITYQYDPNTLRMTQYGAALSNGTVSGTLTWNPNGSLQQLTIADPVNPQTCTYGADDVSRIASVNCVNGSTNVWGQNFTYDAFGNITKQVPSGGTGISWMPGYYAGSNHYSLGGTSYDADGNLTNDTFNKYTWDAEGKVLSTAYSEGSGQTWTFVYDAFGHKVEWSVNGGYYRSYVTLGNFKLSAQGQTAMYSEFPFPGGSVLGQLGGGTGVYLGDWLGTIRAAYSYAGGTFGQSGAHAPFGEWYASTGGNPLDFTGQQNDINSTNTTYYFTERQYRSSQGRWLSPDPAGLAAVDFANPQSWNRYTYAMNRPLSVIDPFGLDPCPDGSESPSGVPCVTTVISPPPPPIPTFQVDLTGADLLTLGAWNGGRANQLNSFIRHLRWSIRNAANKLRARLCSKLPNGATMGASTSLGTTGGQTFGIEVVTNFDTGQISAFAYGGPQAGWNNVVSGNISNGLIWGLNGSNANYQGPFTNVYGSGPSIGGYVSASSQGVGNGISGAVHTSYPAVVGVTVGASAPILPGGGGTSVTYYTKPLQLGKYWTPLLNPSLLAGFSMRQTCP